MTTKSNDANYLIGIQEASFYYLHTLHLFMHCVLKDYKLPFKALDTICTVYLCMNYDIDLIEYSLGKVTMGWEWASVVHLGNYEVPNTQ